jgi:hypothetical protein
MIHAILLLHLLINNIDVPEYLQLSHRASPQFTNPERACVGSFNVSMEGVGITLTEQKPSKTATHNA